jgi:diguanylate cyclase (GGDEF)-like protein
MLGASVVLAHFAVFELQLFDLVPTAHSLVFNSMREAVLVTDLSHRLVEFNPAAAELLPRLRRSRTGEDVATVLSDLPGLDDIFRKSAAPREIDLRVGGIVQYFELRVFPLRVDDQQLGWTAILANVTAQRRLVEDLRRDAETDELTAVANRRSFLAAAERESSRSDRYRTPFTVMLVDLDYLKDINDRYGHAAGDKALCTVADRILECLRSSDVLSRYGGDEFAILLPETDGSAALEAAERIRTIAATYPVEHQGNKIDLSVSIGIVTHDASAGADWKQLLERADRALYEAKARGRSRVVAWEAVATQGD